MMERMTLDLLTNEVYVIIKAISLSLQNTPKLKRYQSKEKSLANYIKLKMAKL